jgi:hypothetical protein
LKKNNRFEMSNNDDLVLIREYIDVMIHSLDRLRFGDSMSPSDYRKTPSPVINKWKLCIGAGALDRLQQTIACCSEFDNRRLMIDNGYHNIFGKILSAEEGKTCAVVRMKTDFNPRMHEVKVKPEGSDYKNFESFMSLIINFISSGRFDYFCRVSELGSLTLFCGPTPEDDHNNLQRDNFSSNREDSSPLICFINETPERKELHLSVNVKAVARAFEKSFGKIIEGPFHRPLGNF